jgi:Zn-dependent protease with chaperone function
MTLGDLIAKATLKLFGIEMTGAWLETEEEVLESRARLRNRLGSLLKKGEIPEERREEVLNALDVDEQVSALCIFGESTGLLTKLVSTHPPVEERIQRLRS